MSATPSDRPALHDRISDYFGLPRGVSELLLIGGLTVVPIVALATTGSLALGLAGLLIVGAVVSVAQGTPRRILGLFPMALWLGASAVVAVVGGGTVDDHLESWGMLGLAVTCIVWWVWDRRRAAGGGPAESAS
jgi:hypothetical protein